MLNRRYVPILGSVVSVVDLETTGIDPLKNAIINYNIVSILPQSWEIPLKELDRQHFKFSSGYFKLDELTSRENNKDTMKFHSDLPVEVQRLNYGPVVKKPIKEQLIELSNYMSSLDEVAEESLSTPTLLEMHLNLTKRF